MQCQNKVFCDLFFQIPGIVIELSQDRFFKEILEMDLREVFEDKLEILKEEASKDGEDMLLTATFCKADEANKNGRLYPTSVLKNAIQKLSKRIERDNAILASSGHTVEMEVNKVSHMIEDVWFNEESKTGQCNVRIIPTSEGRNVSTILTHGGSLGLSMSGIGTMTKKENYNQVNDDYELRQVDIVVSPGFEDARFSKKDIIGESFDLEKVLEDREKIIQRVGQIEKERTKPSAKQIEERYRSLYKQAKASGAKLTYEQYKERMTFGVDAELKERYLNDKQNAGCKLSLNEWIEKFGK